MAAAKSSYLVTFDEALAKIRAEADDRTNMKRKGSNIRKTQLGFAFEKLMLEYFKHDSIQGPEFTDVKLWYDWYQEPDTGIDIVARDKRGDLVGVQCKCWADSSSIDLKEISTMFATKSKKKIDRLILVFTGQTLTSHAQTTCEDAGVIVLMQSDLRRSSFDWNTAKKRIIPKPKSLKPHQIEAVKMTVEGFRNTDRGKLIMACGTGKTLTSLHIAERTVGVGGLVLYLVPSLSLIPQTMREWADNKSMPHHYMAVCSDRSTASDEQGSITEIPIRPSTNVDDLKNEYEVMDRKSSMCVVFSTYNSVAMAAKALLEHDRNGMFDLILFDEAHKTTGAEKIKESYYLEAHNNPAPGREGGGGCAGQKAFVYDRYSKGLCKQGK